MIIGTCKLHTTRNGVMQVLSKFCHNKHLTREMTPFRINTTDAYSYFTHHNAQCVVIHQCYFYYRAACNADAV